jgi:hypothetical protein
MESGSKVGAGSGPIVGAFVLLALAFGGETGLIAQRADRYRRVLAALTGNARRPGRRSSCRMSTCSAGKRCRLLMVRVAIRVQRQRAQELPLTVSPKSNHKPVEPQRCLSRLTLDQTVIECGRDK